jgi:outer membrane usher protein
LFRRHDHGGEAARQLGCAGILFLVLCIVPHPAVANEVSAVSAPDPNADQSLLLDVQVNGHSIGKIGEFTLRHGKLMIRPDELRDLGFRLPASLVLSADGLITMSDMPGLIWSLDQTNLELYVTASDNRLLPIVLQPGARDALSERRVIESGTGVTLNYDTVGSFSSGQTGGTGSMDLRAFSPWGIVSSGWLAFAGSTSSGSGTNTAIRLDSAYTFADVNTLRRYSLGDFITGGLAWTRPIHLEGVQINSDFSMRPDLVTFPLPTITGSAAVPSTVDVLADGNLMVASQVAAGPFEVPQLPVVSGAGTISMTVTNALGQQVNVTQPFYASSALLAPGLKTFAVQSGLVRRNWGSVSNDYGKIAGAAIYRSGLTPKFTLEGSVESTPGTFAVGAGGVAQIGHLGVVNFSAATSAGTANTGAQFSAGAQRIGRVFSLGASAILANSNYRDVASMNGDGVPRKQLSGFTSLYLPRFGSLGAAYGGIDQDAAPTPVRLNISPAEHSHVVSANYSLQIRHVSIYASEFKNFAGTGGSSGTQVGLTIPFGRRSSVTVSATSDGDGQLQAQRSAALVNEWGYDAYVSAGKSNHEFAQAAYKSPVGLFTAGIDQSAGLTSLRLESQGAFSWVDKGLFPSNTIYDSFAIVDTGPVPHVHVLQENRDVGSTGSSGRLLVPDMRSFDLNHIAISPTDIPADVTIDVATREMRPQDRSGVVVKFQVKISHAALLRLVDGAGAPMPLGSAATLRATGVTVPVGYDGDAYVEDLSSHNELAVERMDGRRCTVVFDYRPLPGEVPTIGPLRCQEQKP